VVIGDRFTTGHFGLVRERTEIGDDVVVGTNVTIDGTTTVGSNASFQTGAYVPAKSTIGDHVFLGPQAVLTNDPYPLRRDVELEGRSSRITSRSARTRRSSQGDSRAGIVRRRRRRRDERRPETNPRGGVAGEPRAASGVASRGNGQ